MLRITKSELAAGAKRYFKEALQLADYYRAGDTTIGWWHGRTAARLGLTGQVHEAEFALLVDNRKPDGSKLTARDRANRVPGIDFTANAPKSVSILWALTGDDRILQAHREAVRWMMAEVERDVKTRVRKGGRNEDRKTGNCLWAEFLHETSRPVNGIPDPHLHTHAYMLNVTWDEVERSFKAVQIGDIKGEGEYYQSVYLAVLAKRMAELGFPIERKGKWWEIGGVERSLVEAFSNRTRQIEQAALEAGILSEDRKAQLAKRTRERKSGDVALDDLKGIWQARIGPQARRIIDAVLAGLKSGANQMTRLNVRELGRIVLSDVLGGESATSEKKVLQSLLQRGYGDILPHEARAAIEAQGVIRGIVGGRDWITTKQALEQERAILAFARSGRNSRLALGSGSYGVQSDWLNAQQRNAIHHLWSSQDRVMLLRGGAGVGKTTLMGEAIAGIAAAGHRNFVFASTIAATEVLRGDGFAGAQTVQKLLASDALQQKLGRDAVIWVDEAGLVDTGTMQRLFDVADRFNWRVVLVGDEKQHKPVDRGDALRILRERAHLPVAEVTEIVRQRGAYKDAVAAIEQGDVVAGWQKLEAMGAIVEASGAERAQRLASDYLSATERGERVLVVAPTNRERLEVTELIRWLLKHEGKVDAEERAYSFLRNLYWRDEAKGDADRYEVGHIVRFWKHAPGGIQAGIDYVVEGRSDLGHVIIGDGQGGYHELPLDMADRFQVFAREERSFSAGDRVRMVETATTTQGRKLTKGSFHTITGFTDAGEIMLEHDRVLPASFTFLDHGYVTTSVSSQGLTVDTVLLAMGAQSVPAMS